MGDGRQIYQRLVKPKRTTPEKVVNHFAISSLFEDGKKEKKIFSYSVERIGEERLEKEDRFLVLGQVKVSSEIIPETEEYVFGLIPSKKDIYRTWVLKSSEGLPLEALKAKIAGRLGEDEEELTRILTSAPRRSNLYAAGYLSGGKAISSARRSSRRKWMNTNGSMQNFLTGPDSLLPPW